MAELTGLEILALPMGANDANAKTVRDYLVELLLVLWDEQDGFSGKRPFGNSDWDGELHRALAMAGVIIDDGWSRGAADVLISRAIQALRDEPAV